MQHLTKDSYLLVSTFDTCTCRSSVAQSYYGNSWSTSLWQSHSKTDKAVLHRGTLKCTVFLIWNACHMFPSVQLTCTHPSSVLIVLILPFSPQQKLDWFMLILFPRTSKRSINISYGSLSLMFVHRVCVCVCTHCYAGFEFWHWFQRQVSILHVWWIAALYALWGICPCSFRWYWEDW